jgi:DNA-binding response OmpR family regulator
MSKSVLLVDRSLNLRLLLSDYLKSKELEVHTAESIEKGWQLYVETKPDLIVSDIAIEFKDCGYEFLKQVRDFNPQQPFIFLSSQLNNSINRKNTMRLGVNACFDKPFEPDELYREIESILYS